MRGMGLGRAVLVVSLCGGMSVAQELKTRPPAGAQVNNDDSSRVPQKAEAESVAPLLVPMSVTAGTPIKVALDSEVRVREVGRRFTARRPSRCMRSTSY